jgi:hypothetical protein
MEISDPSRSYSWTNNQEKPIMAKLDRILVPMEWDKKYPTSQVTLLPKEVSDHYPMKISFGLKHITKEPIFRFEKCWLECEDFYEIVRKAWDIECLSSDPVSV